MEKVCSSKRDAAFTSSGPDRNQKRKGGAVIFGCSLFARFSVSTIGLEPSQQTTTGRKQHPFPVQWIYKIANKTGQKLYFATILDLEHQQTPLTTVSCTFLKT